MSDALRTGIWLTRDRAYRVATAMVATTILSLLYILSTAHGTVDAWGRPVGTDFSNVWTAGWMADHGRAAAAWNWPDHYAVQRALHGTDVPFYGWHYPPPFLLVAALLALMPYMTAYLVWQATTLAAAVAIVRRIVPDRGATLISLGFPAVFVCIGHGQNGFLTAALLGGGLLSLKQRPLLAGVLIGCLCYKPQFAPVLPVLLIADGQWRAMLAAAVTVLALMILTTAIWGGEIWTAFAASLPLTRGVVIEGAGTGAYKIVSAFAAIRLNGGGVAAAYVVQGVVSGVVVVGIILARHAPVRVRYALAAAAALLATPYAFDYDMVVLGIAIAFLVAEAQATGWRSWERTLLAFVYMAPLVGRTIAALTGGPLGLAAIVAVWGLAARRALPAATPSPCRRSHGSSAR